MTGNVNYGLGHLHTANFYPMKTLGDCKLWGPCRENLHYLWKRVVSIVGKPRDNYRSCNFHGVSPQFLQAFLIDSADFSCRDPAIPSHCNFHGVKIGSALFCR